MRFGSTLAVLPNLMVGWRGKIGDLVNPPHLLGVCAGEDFQHVLERREGQVHALHVMLTEGCQADSGIACDGTLGGFQAPIDEPQQRGLANACTEPFRDQTLPLPFVCNQSGI